MPHSFGTSGSTNSGLRLRGRSERAHGGRKIQRRICAGSGYFERVDRCRSTIAMPRIAYISLHRTSGRQTGSIDLAFTNGVFHHIPPARACRVPAYDSSLIASSGGLFAFWENNPWNPGTQYVMSQCAFDENAVKISPREARRLLAADGFKILRTDSLFYFPRQLRVLRPLERWLRGLPLGGQYLMLCQNPSG